MVTGQNKPHKEESHVRVLPILTSSLTPYGLLIADPPKTHREDHCLDH